MFSSIYGSPNAFYGNIEYGYIAPAIPTDPREIFNVPNRVSSLTVSADSPVTVSSQNRQLTVGQSVGITVPNQNRIIIL